MAERALREHGIEVRMGFETEWVVTSGSAPDRDSGIPAPFPASGPAYGMARLVGASDYLRDVLSALTGQGVEVLQIHPEYAPGQFEVSVAPSDPVGAADLAVLVRETVRAVSLRHGLTALFGPVVDPDGVGSGAHVHLSLWREGRNLCAGGTGPFGMTPECEAFLAGVLRQLPALLALGAPSPAGYLRLRPSRWAGAFQCWGPENREAALRFIAGTARHPQGANAEVKCVDAAANPYLLVGGVIAAGLAGLADGDAARLVDTGLPGPLLTPGELAEAAGAEAHEIVRLERLAERAADTARDTHGFLAEVSDGIRAAVRTARGFKSVAAYRCGLGLAPSPPGTAEIYAAADRWLASRVPGGRLTDPVLERHLLWSAVRTGLPLQIHTGFGDPDLRLDHCDPLLLTDFIRATAPYAAPLILLHCYPYHRGAGYLAAVFPHVYADFGLSLCHTGARARAVLAELMELTPFGKLLFSTDAYALPELYLVGARLFREAVTELTREWVERGEWSPSDAGRVTAMIAGGTARRLYGL
ncbi:amidohydrolase family protein [Streptomyces albus]|uniref:amidohydrolase family protein n=1 Tax=Streptomyces albus TaxID=1888 RepID=UPI003D0EAE39